MAEIEEALNAKVSRVCRNYCRQVWNEAFIQAWVETSSTLKRTESIYYPFTIHAPSSASSKVDTSSDVAELRKGSLAKVPPSSNSPFEKAQQHRVIEKEADANKGVASDATKPPVVSQDPPKEKEVPSTMEVVIATLLLPAKGDLKSKT